MSNIISSARGAIGALVTGLKGKARKPPIDVRSKGVRGVSSGSLHPFKRAIEYRQRIDEIRSKGLSPLEQQAEIAALPPYQGRGKGRGKGKARRANRNGSRYAPHQGAQERIRRLIGGWAGQPLKKAGTLARYPLDKLLATVIKHGTAFKHEAAK